MILKISRFSNIWFFDASSNSTLTANFKEIGNAAGVGENIKSVRDFLVRINQNWLCIFDNADDQEVFLKEYIPSCNHGNVIVTSRLTETSQMATPGWHIHLSNLSSESAVELLLKHANEESSNNNISVAGEVVNALGFHALAVSTAGAYIGATPTCTLQKYMTYFDKKRSKMLNYRMRSLDNYQRTVFSAFQLSFDQLSHPSQYLMQICAYLHPTAIPLAIFTQAAAFTGSDTSSVDLDPPTDSMNSMKEFLSLFEDEASWEDNVVELCRLSLASYDILKACIIFHPVIHTCARETVVKEVNMFQIAMLLLGRAIPLGKTDADFRFRHQLVIHASHIQARNLPTVCVQVALAKVFKDSGFWDKTEKLEEEVLLLHKKAIGVRHPDTLSAMENLGVTYRVCGKVEAAEKLEEEVLLLRKEVIGEHHPDTLLSMNNLGLTYWACGKSEAAEKLQEEVLSLRNEVIGERHPDTLISMNNLGLTYWTRGKFEAAEKLQEDVLLLQKEAIGVRHPDTLRSMNNLGLTYWARGKLEAAEKLQEEVLLLRKEVIGECHPDTLGSMNNLGTTYRTRGKLEAAEKLLEEVLSLRKEVIGEHHPNTLTFMNNLGNTYQESGKLEAAEKLHEEVLLLRKEVIGEHHPHTLKSMDNLGNTYRTRGRLEVAEKLQEEGLLLCKEVIGEHHPHTLISMGNLGTTYQVCGKLAKAEKL
ncbi:TPR-like protein, partial [Gymnopus androsaceus JB14]